MYTKLYQHWLREQEAEDLRELEKDFWSEVVAYRIKLQQKLGKLNGSDWRYKLLKQELENYTFLSRSLLDARLRKIFSCLHENKSLNPSNLTLEETEIYSELHSGSTRVNDLRERLVSAVVPPGFEEEAMGKTRRVMVRFMKDTPALIGADMQIYGPFKTEDVANLPEENGELLIKTGIARRIVTQ